MSIFMDEGRISALYSIIPETISINEIAREYSRLKFGQYSAVRRFCDELTCKIAEEIGDLIQDDPTGFVVINPGGSSRVPNAAFLLASGIARRFRLPHLSLAVPLSQAEQRKYRTQSRSVHPSFQVFLNRRTQLMEFPSLVGKKIVFVDDCFFSGSIIRKSQTFLSQYTEAFFPYVALRLEASGIPLFEKMLDTLVIRDDTANVIASMLNDAQSIYTTRLIHHFMSVDEETFESILGKLTTDSMARLYLFSIAYCGQFVSSKLDRLVMQMPDSYDRSVAVSSTDFQKLASHEVFEHVANYLTRTDFKTTSHCNSKTIRSLRGWIERGSITPDIQAVLFDLDHTLAMSRNYYDAVRQASQNYISQCNRLSLYEIKRIVDDLRAQCLSQGRAMSQYDVANRFELAVDNLDQYIFESVEATNYFLPDEQLQDLLENLRGEGLRLAILTNSPPRQAKAIIDAIGIAQLVDQIFTPDKVACLKPDEKFFVSALNQLGCVATHAVMIGDSRTLDLAPALGLNMQVHLVRSRERLFEVTKNLRKHSRLEQCLSNIFYDIEGLKKKYKNGAIGTECTRMLLDYLKVFQVFSPAAELSPDELLFAYQTIFRYLYTRSNPNKLTLTDVDTTSRQELYRLRGTAKHLTRLARKMTSYPNRIYLGIDSLFWLAADPKGTRYNIDGFAFLSPREFYATMPFLGQLLPEHHSIVREVMYGLIRKSVERSRSDKEFERIMWAAFEAELESCRPLQKKLLKEKTRLLVELKRKHGGLSTDREEYLLTHTKLLEEKNVFADQARVVGEDFAETVLRKFVSTSDVTIIDRAIAGAQPLFLQGCIRFRKRNETKIGCKLVVGQSQIYRDRSYKFIIRERFPEVLERIRPVTKDRVRRKHPMEPVYVFGRFFDQLYGMLLLLIISSEVAREN
jgi:phosphoglycolate phosphatase